MHWLTGSHNYLYHVVTTDDFVDYLTNNATGSAYPAVNTADFEKATILLPPKDVVDMFHAIVDDMLAQHHNLSAKNTALRRTRDLLLPRLISGAVDVSELDIAIPEEDEG